MTDTPARWMDENFMTLILIQKTEMIYLSFLNCEFNHKGMFLFLLPRILKGKAFNL